MPLLDAVEAVRTVGGGTFLDVGTGSGSVAGAAASRGYSVLGVDAEESMIRTARCRHPELSFIEGALPVLPLESDQFDAVAASFVLNHLPDISVGVAELARVTAPHGAVAVTVWPPGASPLRPLWEEMLDRSGVAV